MGKQLYCHADSDEYLTHGETYDVVGENDYDYTIIDDTGDRHAFSKEPDGDGDSYATWLTFVTENVTVLTDGLGLQREYTEVKRKANVGERIRVFGHMCLEANGIFTAIDGLCDGHTQWDTGRSGIYGTLDGFTYVVLEPSDIVRMDSGTHGGRYRLVERKADVGERVVVVNTSGEVDAKIGEVLTIERVSDGSLGFVYGNRLSTCMDTYNYRVLTPLASETPTAPQTALSVQVAELTARVTELEAEVTDLRRMNTPRDETEDRRKQPLTRDEVVAKAKADVAELLRIGTNDDGDLPSISGFNGRWYEVKFVVNRDKRTVVALVHELNGFSDKPYTLEKDGVFAKCIAKCAPGDVFNAHIGKAIALRRALGLDVPTEYTKAPQPTEARVGDVVTWKYSSWRYEIVDLAGVGGNLRGFNIDGTRFTAEAPSFDTAIILEDTVSTGGEA